MNSARELHLSFGDRMHESDSAEKNQGAAKRLEPRHGSHASLDGFQCDKIGATFVDGPRFGHAILGDRFLKVTRGCSLVPMSA
jgi:hypothetical protein